MLSQIIAFNPNAQLLSEAIAALTVNLYMPGTQKAFGICTQGAP